ncbi:helix-turn-helix domain-containing protein [Bifidobacterium pseudocatenulatum]|uniref:helix-turn-helix domain-containing protein n=1 Tax=Bifidobacterium pseudocatenulatum TaxID=28026 RepID=UPI0030EC4F4A
MPGTLAGEGSRVCRPYGETHHPAGNEDQGDRTGAGRHARKRAAERFGAGVGAIRNWVKAYREGGMAALQPRNRNASQTNKPAPRRSRNARAVGDDVEALRRRVEELELENALMREVVEVVKKTQAPTYGACRTGRRRCRSTV